MCDVKEGEANRRLDKRVRQFCSRVDEFNRVSREGTALDGYSTTSRGGSAVGGMRPTDYYGAQYGAEQPMSDAERTLATRTPRSRFGGPTLMTPAATDVTIVI